MDTKDTPTATANIKVSNLTCCVIPDYISGSSINTHIKADFLHNIKCKQKEDVQNAATLAVEWRLDSYPLGRR